MLNIIELSGPVRLKNGLKRLLDYYSSDCSGLNKLTRQNPVEGYTELDCSKWKNGKGFLQPNFGVGPNPERFLLSLHNDKIIWRSMFDLLHYYR